MPDRTMDKNAFIDKAHSNGREVITHPSSTAIKSERVAREAAARARSKGADAHVVNNGHTFEVVTTVKK